MKSNGNKRPTGTPTPPGHDAWLELLVEFFRSGISSALGEVLDASCCREGWLHGELYRHFHGRLGHESFAVNTLQIGRNKKADFASEVPARSVGEVKIIGNRYEQKCITGGALGPLMDRIDQPICAGDRSLVLGPWGLIPDFFRLLDYAADAQRDAYLALVADLRGPAGTSMDLALRRINFVTSSRDIESPFGLVRIWSVTSSCVRVR